MERAAVGLFKKENDVATIVSELKSVGVTDEHLLVLGHDDAAEVGEMFNEEASEGAVAGAAAGTSLGALIGSIALLPIPGLNIAAAAGFMSAVVGGIGGGYLGAIYGTRANTDEEYHFRDELEAGAVIIVAGLKHASEEQVLDIFRQHNGEHIGVHDMDENALAHD